MLAEQLGIGPEELRELLRREIERATARPLGQDRELDNVPETPLSLG